MGDACSKRQSLRRTVRVEMFLFDLECLVDNDSQKGYAYKPMNLKDAPYLASLKIQSVDLPVDVQEVLLQLGVGVDDVIQKVHQAPLGDPIGLRVGDHLFSLRGEICEKIQVVKV